MNRPVPWLALLQIGIGTTLIVLFAVMLERSQRQSRAIERLDQRLQGLENARALERTSALEGQLRKMLTRIDALEASQRRLAETAASRDSLLEELRQLRRGPSLVPQLGDAALPEPAPPPPRRPGRPFSPGEEQTPGMLRPPGF